MKKNRVIIEIAKSIYSSFTVLNEGEYDTFSYFDSDSDNADVLYDIVEKSVGEEEASVYTEKLVDLLEKIYEIVYFAETFDGEQRMNTEDIYWSLGNIKPEFLAYSNSQRLKVLIILNTL